MWKLEGITLPQYTNVVYKDKRVSTICYEMTLHYIYALMYDEFSEFYLNALYKIPQVVQSFEISNDLGKDENYF